MDSTKFTEIAEELKKISIHLEEIENDKDTHLKPMLIAEKLIKKLN